MKLKTKRTCHSLYRRSERPEILSYLNEDIFFCMFSQYREDLEFHTIFRLMSVSSFFNKKFIYHILKCRMFELFQKKCGTQLHEYKQFHTMNHVSFFDMMRMENSLNGITLCPINNADHADETSPISLQVVHEGDRCLTVGRNFRSQNIHDLMVSRNHMVIKLTQSIYEIYNDTLCVCHVTGQNGVIHIKTSSDAEIVKSFYQKNSCFKVRKGDLITLGCVYAQSRLTYKINTI